MSECPCGSKKSFEDCCSPYLEGKKSPPTAESLMRARYSAFVKQNVDFIMNSHHPETEEDLSRTDIESWSKNSEWISLEVRSHDFGGENDTEGKVEFIASYLIDGKRHDHHELSEFRRHEGEWRFYDGKVFPRSLVRTAPKVGRNDPCPCGSGKKHKKCCLV